MLGLLLVLLGGLFDETSMSLAKHEVAVKTQSFYAAAFLNTILAATFLLLFGIFFHHPFIFSSKSLPTFIVRAVLEISLVFITLTAILKADRSTFSFIRIITIPLLLLVDISLGYSISTYQ